MARLPTPGGDDGTWGQVLNTFLDVEHNTDGSLKIRTDGTLSGLYSKPAGGIPTADIADGAVTTTKLSSSVQTTLGNVGNATKLQGVGVSNSAPTDGQSLVYDGTSSTWAPATVTAGGSVPDADASTKGLVQLAGDLAGTGSSASAPRVSGVNGVAVSGTPSNGQVLTASSGTAAAWATPSTAPVTSVAGKTGAVTLAASDITSGTLTLNQGGTGATSQAGAANAVLPSQTGNSGKYLTTNGTNVSWGSVSAGGGDFVFTPVSKTANYTPSDGEFVVCDSTGGGFTVTLLAASSGARIRVGLLSGTNAVLVQSVVGATSVSFNTVGQTQEFYSDGTNWWAF